MTGRPASTEDPPSYYVFDVNRPAGTHLLLRARSLEADRLSVTEGILRWAPPETR
jgi:hypothetical protein